MPAAPLTIRNARLDDLSALVELLFDDWIGAQRETVSASDREVYEAAFAAIDHDPRNELIVGEFGDNVVAMLQLTYIPGLTHRGSERAQIEGVRVSSAMRGTGIGEQLFAHAIERARERGCGIVQLTTDKRRGDAQRFYDRLGFVSSHEGLKLRLRNVSESESS